MLGVTKIPSLMSAATNRVEKAGWKQGEDTGRGQAKGVHLAGGSGGYLVPGGVQSCTPANPTQTHARNPAWCDLLAASIHTASHTVCAFFLPLKGRRNTSLPAQQAKAGWG